MKKISLMFASFSLIVLVFGAISLKVYAALPNTFDCEYQTGGCFVGGGGPYCKPGYKTDQLACTKLNHTQCNGPEGKNIPCVEDLKPNTVTCQLVHGRTGATCEVKAGTDECKTGYVPDCSKRSGPDCEASTGQCILDIPRGGPTIPVYDPTCASGGPYGINYGGVKTALGCLPTDPQAFINTATPWAVGIGAGIAFLLGILGAVMIVLSAGNPEKMQAGKEMITSAVGGLILIVFSVFLLRIIGVDVLKLF